MDKKYTYEANKSFGEIKKLEVEKETEKTVWIRTENGYITQNRKQSDCNNYFETFNEAKNFLLEKQKSKVGSIKNNLEYQKEKLEKIKNLIEEN